MTTIRYFIPEDGDLEMTPNVFLAPKARQSGMPPTLGQIKSAFPLPGVYHFRFKAPLFPGGDREKNSVAVWMDSVDDRQPVPIWQNAIIAKVTRLSTEEDDDDDDSDFGSPQPAPTPQQQRQPAPTPQQHQAAPPRATAEPMLDIFDGPSPSIPSHSAPTSNNLFDAPNPAPAASASLLDMGHAPAVQGYGHSAPSSAHDFLGMTAAPTLPQQPAFGGFPGQSPGYPPQQQQQYQQAPSSGSNAFDAFGNQQGPFGGLNWK